MSDERDRPVGEPEPRVERETTVIHTGDGGRGSGGLIALVLVLLAILVIGFLYFGNYFESAADEVGVNVNVEAPDVELPDINLPEEKPAAPAPAPANSN